MRRVPREIGRPSTRVGAGAMTLGGALLLLAGCPPTPPTNGNLQVLAGGATPFSATIAQDPAAFNVGQLLAAPNSPVATETTAYSDGFSTQAAPTYLLVMARDPGEQEASLESIYQGNTEALQWLFESYGPGDTPPPAVLGQYPPPDGVTLPDAYGIPYPQTSFDRTNGSAPTSWPLSLADFTESASVQLDVPGPGGIQGLYLQQVGVCAFDVDIQSQIVNTITSTVPSQVVVGVDSSLAQDLSASAANLTAVTTFLNRTSEDEINGGFVTILDTYVSFPFTNATYIALNYTFNFGLTNGIFSVFTALNGESHSGTFAQTIEGQLESKVPRGISSQVYLTALTAQAQPVPTSPLTPPPGCSGSPVSSNCYIPCVNLPARYPPALAGTQTDDSSWYDMDYCGTAAGLLKTAATVGANDYGISGQAATDIGSIFTSNDGTNYNFIRCNFYPTYETDVPAVPVCEVSARAKRINVFPDKVQLVWFDGPDLGHVGPDEYGNEAFALFLALTASDDGGAAAASVLCRSQQADPFMLLGPSSRRFAHGYGTY